MHSSVNIHQQIFMQLLSSSLRDKESVVPITNGVNWNYIYELSTAHRVETLLYSTLRKLTEEQGISSDLLYNWKLRSQCQGLNQIQHIARIKEVLLGFHNATLPVIALKGLVFRNWYPVPEFRLMYDADLLVHEGDLPKASNLLVAMGYEEVKPSGTHHIVFEHTKYQSIELHWLLSSPSCVINTEELEKTLWQNTIQTQVAGVPVLSLSLEDQLVFSILHTAKHLVSKSFSIRMLCDVVVLIENNRNTIHWKCVEQKVKKAAIEKFTQLLFFTCQQLLDFSMQGIPVFDEGITKNILQDFEQDIFSPCESETKKRIQGVLMSSAISSKNNRTNGVPGKLRLLLHTLFPTGKKLPAKYGYAVICPLLYPVAWVIRIIRMLFFRHLSVKECTNLNDLLTSTQTRTKLLHKLGL